MCYYIYIVVSREMSLSVVLHTYLSLVLLVCLCSPVVDGVNINRTCSLSRICIYNPTHVGLAILLELVMCGSTASTFF